MHLEGYADGAFELYSYYSGNSYTVGTNDPVELQSAVIDRRSDDYYTIYLAPQAGLTDLEQIRQAEGVVTIKAAPQALDGLLVSFANEKDAGRILSIAYAGKTYDNQGDNTKSTIHGATAKQKIALAFYEATNEMTVRRCAINNPGNRRSDRISNPRFDRQPVLPESSSSPLFEGGFFPTLHPAKAKNRARTFYFRIVINFAVLPKIRNKNHRHSRYFKKKR